MTGKESKKEILKSTGILASAQVAITLVSIVRVKVLAVLLGPAGVGVAGLYQSTIDFIKAATGFGLGSSAVRDIAASAAEKDVEKISTTIYVLRKWVWFTGILGMLVSLIFCKTLSRFAFGDDRYAIEIAILSVSLLIISISGGQSALLQGLRRISDMAKAKVLSAIFGTIGSVFIYYFWGFDGIVAAIILTHLVVLIVNYFYSRRIETIPVSLPPLQVLKKGRSMAELGFFLSITSITSTGTMYAVRAFVTQQGGLDSIGHFVAAWSISTIYISAILSAMGSDFYPRLSGVQHDSGAIRKMVNEQSEIALLITAPIIIGMVSFVDVVVILFYSKGFGPTNLILNWQLIGDFFKILSWPMGFILIAKGKGKLYVMIELTWNLLFIGAVYYGWSYFGIEMAGIAYLTSYILYLFLVFFLVNRLVQFKWSKHLLRLGLTFLPILIASFFVARYLDYPLQYLVGAGLTIMAALISYYYLKNIIDFSKIIKRIR